MGVEASWAGGRDGREVYTVCIYNTLATYNTGGKDGREVYTLATYNTVCNTHCVCCILCFR